MTVVYPASVVAASIIITAQKKTGAPKDTRFFPSST
jgi:hypothetical protein